jgi:hypothetical protein
LQPCRSSDCTFFGRFYCRSLKTVAYYTQGRVCERAMLARWAAPFALLSYLVVDLHLILKNSAGIHAGRDIQRELLQWVKKLRPKPQLEQAWPLHRMDPSPWRVYRVVSREQGSLSRTLEWEGGEEFRFLLSKDIISGRAQEAVGSTEAVFVCALAEGGGPGAGGWSAPQAGPWRFGVQATWLAGGVSASNSAVGLPPRPRECVPLILVA